jgi:hypothetical protein
VQEGVTGVKPTFRTIPAPVFYDFASVLIAQASP